MAQQKTSWGVPLITLIAVLAAIVLAFIGSGVLGGTPISQAADGALSADATPFAPAGPAFSIWSVVYVGLAGYAVYQLLPNQRSSARQAQLRPWAAVSAVLNAAWIGAVQFGLLLGSVVVIVLLLVVLLRILRILRTTSPKSPTDILLTHGTFGLYTGWVCVAVTANVAAWVATLGVSSFQGWQWAATGILAVIAVLGLALAGMSRGAFGPALAISWGLSWIAVARSEGNFESVTLVWAAAIAAAVVLVGTAIVRMIVERRASKSTW